MNWNRKNSLVAAGLLAVLGTSACRTAPPLHVIVDPSLASAEVYDVSGIKNRVWGKPIQFGPFSTAKTRVGSTWSWTSGVFDFSVGANHQPYRFVFNGEQGEKWQVECHAKTPILRHETRHGEWTIPIGETRLGCAMRNDAGEVRSLALAGNGLDFRGAAGFGDDPIEIRTLHEIPGRDGKPFRIPGTPGYELRRNDRVVGSVDLMRHRVYLAQGLPADLRTPVAMTATVLLFFGEA